VLAFLFIRDRGKNMTLKNYILEKEEDVFDKVFDLINQYKSFAEILESNIDEIENLINSTFSGLPMEAATGFLKEGLKEDDATSVLIALTIFSRVTGRSIFEIIQNIKKLKSVER
jgi:hypothetical protein